MLMALGIPHRGLSSSRVGWPGSDIIPNSGSCGSSGLGTGLRAGHRLGSCRWQKAYLAPHSST